MTPPLTERFFLSAIFLSPALLLWTPNFTVGVVGLTVFLSLYVLFNNKNSVSIDQFDWAVVIGLSAYVLANIPVAVIDGDTFRYFKGPIRFLLCIPIYLALKITLKSKASATSAMELGVIVGSFGALGIAIYQFFILAMPRVDGFLYSINFGYLSCALSFLALCLVKNSQRKIWLLSASVAAAFATTLTLTRGAMFAIPILLSFVALLNWKRFSLKLISISALVVIAISVAAYNSIDAVEDRIDYTIMEFTQIAQGNTEKAESSGGRLQLWKSAMYAFEKNPIFGSTYEQREEFNKELHAKGEVTDWVLGISRGHAHSQYFEMLAGNGLFGIAAILAILVFPWTFFTYRFLKSNSTLAMTGSVFVAGFMVYGLTEAPLQANLISTFYAFTLATLFALVQLETNGNQSNDSK